MSLDTQDDVLVIRTIECDICQRFDSILMDRKDVEERVNRNSLRIGSHILTHGDHLRIVYFDETGKYLGDTISLNISKPLQEFDKNIPILQKSDNGVIKKFKDNLLRFLSSSEQKICIVGPSMAGKTSLTMYLESGIAECYSKRVNHAPTLGKSLKRFKFGQTNLTVYDMGGQHDFWSQWTESLQNADKVVYILDGTGNNLKEVKSALQLAIKEIHPETPLLILFNKLDLYLDGYSDDFVQPNEVLTGISIPPDLKYWVSKTSIYNGIAYSIEDTITETSLSEIILEFLQK